MDEAYVKPPTSLTPDLYKYMLNHSLREHPGQLKLRQRTLKYDNANFQIGADEGAFFQILIKILNAKKTIELGVFTGYSSLAVALALPPDGKIIACDSSKEYTDIAKEFWKECGVENKIDLRLAPALETLEKLLSTGQENTFDFAFIDADKNNYDNYYELCLKLIRPDNVFYHRQVIQKENLDEKTKVVIALNEKIHKDTRVDICTVAVCDGITLCYKK